MPVFYAYEEIARENAIIMFYSKRFTTSKCQKKSFELFFGENPDHLKYCGLA